MSIELHCPQCRKLIRAPDSAGGKRGKCPYCKNAVYIPTPSDESEEIGLAPLDDDEEKRAKALRRESIRYAASVDHVTDAGPDAGAAGASTGGVHLPFAPGEVVDLGGEVEAFILAMRDSKLDLADAAVARLRRAASRARQHLQTLVLDDMPPEFENVPPPVVKGFLKTLLNRLG